MRVVSLGSGSSGNSLFVEAGPRGRTRILIDAGLRGHMLAERLARIGAHPSQLNAILLTHEHSDHTIGLPILLKRYPIPLVTDPRTYTIVQEGLTAGVWRTDSGALSALGADEEQVQAQESLKAITSLPLNAGTRLMLGDIEVTSFPVSHDAVAPCGYLLKAGGCRVCIVTDTGEVTQKMLGAMQHADLLIVEANHDRERLLRGPYPQSLKQRILSNTGHLSNDQAANAILRTWRADGVRWLWLAHLSRTNNTPRLALNSVLTHLRDANANLAQVHISVLPPDMGRMWDSTQLWSASSLWEVTY